MFMTMLISMLYALHVHLFFYTVLILVILCLSAVLTLKARIYLRSKNQLLLQLKEHNEELETLNSRISQQYDLLQQYQLNITESLNYASHMQRAIMPDNSILANSSFSNFILYRPRDIVSGDFYFIKNIRNKLVIALGDCTGHGIPGACLSMMGHALLNEIVHRHDAQNANQVLNILRDKVKNLFHKTGNFTKYQDGMDMALCIIDKFTNKMQFAGANMNLFLIHNCINQPESCEVIKIVGDKMPIGSFPTDNVEFSNIILQLKPGDTFYLFSDGYTSQFGGKNEKKFNTARFIKVLQHIQDQSMTEQQEILEHTFINWQGNQEQVDDVLVIGFKLKSHDEILQNLHQVLISWNNNLYSVGSALIDCQHEQLVLQINQLHDAYMKHCDLQLLGSILDHLQQYIEYHFQTEERFLNKSTSDDIKRHISEHRFFTEKISTFSNQYFNGNTNMTFELILFLKDWLMNHIQCVDFNCKHLFNE